MYYFLYNLVIIIIIYIIFVTFIQITENNIVKYQWDICPISSPFFNFLVFKNISICISSGTINKNCKNKTKKNGMKG